MMNRAVYGIRRSRAFTLIELLIVIAIIAILAAILFPVFATAREKARQATCASNLKQLGLGFAQYEQDFDETMPSGLLTSSTNSSGQYPNCQGLAWGGQVFPYLKSPYVYFCPDDSKAVTNVDHGQIVNETVDYAFNANLPILPLAKIGEPVRVMLLSEVYGYPVYLANPTEMGAWYGGLSPLDYGWACVSGTGNTTPSAWVSTQCMYATGSYYDYNHANSQGWLNQQGLVRHSGGANYLLCDGHVKWCAGTNVTALQPLATCKTTICLENN